MLGRLLGWAKPKVTAKSGAWEFSLAGGATTLRLTILGGSRPATFAQVFSAWTEDPDFRLAYSDALTNCQFSAFRWELPRLTCATVQKPYECVILDSPSLLVPPDPGAFSAHFSQDTEVVAFQNLGKDATLVVPCPLGPEKSYGHLRAFLRTAPDSQKHSLWETIGRQMSQRLGTKPVWLSTAGGGVPWLHIRLDDQPKYYQHQAYR
jgi:hypothetical protein